MDTEAIRLFVLAASKLNISAAGRQLGLAPAVATARLAKLEKQIGADLLHRSTRKISISLEGAEFLPYAKEILAQEDAAFAALGYGSPEITGTIRFAASSTFAQLHIIPFLSEFLERYPGINLELKLSDTSVDLIEGGFDLALRNSAIADSGLMARKLTDDKRIFCASPEYLDRYGSPEVPEDLIDHQLLLFRNSSVRTLLASDGKQSGVFPPLGAKPRVICDDGASMRLATLSGIGISINSYWSVYKEIQNGTLIRVLPEIEVDDRSAVWLVYPKSNVLTAKVRAFIDYLFEKIASPPVWEK